MLPFLLVMPGLSRASTSFLTLVFKDVDGRESPAMTAQADQRLPRQIRITPITASAAP
jgi:hypothetical protein